jgi:hypothetical protein
MAAVVSVWGGAEKGRFPVNQWKLKQRQPGEFS